MATDVDKRVERAKEFFLKGYNCAQSVAMAFADITGMDESSVAAAMAGFGGGMGRMREVCGTVSGMVFLAGFISPVKDPSDNVARTANYALVQHFAKEFRMVNGSIICRELLGMAPKGIDSPQPSERTAEYYRKRPCVELVGVAAGIVAREVSGTL